MVSLIQKTDYPWNGKVEISVDPDIEEEFNILIRITGWTQNKPVPSDLYRYLTKNIEKVLLIVNKETISVKTVNGYVRIRRNWKKGDQISLNLPMPVRRVLSHDKVEDNSGLVALERGPGERAVWLGRN